MQDGTLMDLVDGTRLLCCAMVSEDRERRGIESIYYCLDPYIGLMHVVPSLQDIFNLPIGAGILANTESPQYGDVLLVDSLEGGTLFQQVRNSVSFRLTSQAILGAARDSGSEHILFNAHVGGATALRYNRFIGKKLGTEPEEIYLRKLQAQGITSRKTRYLEAFPDRQRLAGNVIGYLVETDELADVLK